MSVQTHTSAPGRGDLRTAEDVASEEAAVGEDRAVEFLRALAPPSAAERTRAFAALLRALTTTSVR